MRQECTNILEKLRATEASTQGILTQSIENSFVGIMPAATEAHVQSIRVRKDYQKLMRTLACFVDGFKD